MSILPPITVALFTYSPDINHERHAYAIETLDALMRNLRYEGGPLKWHIADDGSGPGHVDNLIYNLREDLKHRVGVVLPPSKSNSERRGYGASYNAMTQVVHVFDGDLVLCVEDDWKMLRPFDLTPIAAAIEASSLHDPIECVRLGYLGWTRQLQGRLVRPIAGQTFLMLDPMSPEHHVFSAGPRIETVKFERRLGLWPEHCIAGEAELAVAGRPPSRIGVAWPLDLGVNAALDNPSLFSHIGGVSVKDSATV